MALNDIFYVASLIVYISRKTNNTLPSIARWLGVKGLKELVSDAQINHCLTFEEVAEEVIEDYKISYGHVEPSPAVLCKTPSHTAMGKVFMRLVFDTQEDPFLYANQLYEIFTSRIAEELTDYSSAFFFASRSEIANRYSELSI